MEPSSSSTHIVKEQFVPEENRDIASFNADNEFNRAINEENMDFNIPGVPHSAVKRSHGVNVRILIQKIENHPQRHALQSDLQQHRQFNPFSKESQDVIKAAGNTELCELLDVEPKAQCKVCLSYWDVGIVYCTCGHFLRDDTTENKKYIKSVLDLFSISHYYIRKGRPHGHRYGKKEGDQEYHTANQLQKKCRKKRFLSIHDRFIRDAWFRKTMIELGRTEEVIREMDKLANEDHTHTLLQKKNSTYTVAIGGYVRILLVPTRCPQGIALISQKRFQPCVASRVKRIKLITKIGGKAHLPRGGNGKLPGGIPHLRHHRDDGLDTDGAGEPAKTVHGLFIRGMSLQTNLVQKFQ